MTCKDAEIIYESKRAIVYVKMPNQYQRRGYVWTCLRPARCGEGARWHGSLPKDLGIDFAYALVNVIFRTKENEGCHHRFIPTAYFNPFEWLFGLQTYERAVNKCVRYAKRWEAIQIIRAKNDLERVRLNRRRRRDTKKAQIIGRKIVLEKF